MRQLSMALPSPAERLWLALGTAVWLAAAMISAAHPTPAPLPAGEIEVEGSVVSSTFEGPFGRWVFVATDLGTILLEVESDIGRGSRVRISGVSDGRSGTARGTQYRAAIEPEDIEILGGPSGIEAGGALIRDRVLDRLRPWDRGRGLLAGFLIGDTTSVSRVDAQAMRRAGLSHFTAVSGSNVVLFLGLLYLAAGPLSLGPRRRALVGLAGLPFFAAATGFEPSVLRASGMAGLVLAARLAGLAFSPWRALALAVGGLAILVPGLAGSVGFQLSVAATAGVLVGSRWPATTRLGRALIVTTSAQVAVAPVLLVYFGSIPLASPVANVLAAPLVTVATLAGSVGVIGLGWLIDPAATVAVWVLDLAHAVSAWPQLGTAQYLALLGAGALVWRLRRWRAPLAVAGAALLVFVVLGPISSPGSGTVVVMDVGQGDSILLSGGNGRYALIDGGPDPVLVVDKLRRYGVTRVELMIATHVHADHVTGLSSVLRSFPVGEIWAAMDPHRTSGSDELVAAALMHQVPIAAPPVGTRFELGALVVEVLGPVRRYASPNDQSLLVMVTGAKRSMLLAGDIETVAQKDLPGLRADVLKVPHQGAATSDAGWLTGVGASEAVISVGPNDFGHPASWVIEVLEETGAVVRRTDEEGDVVVGLG